MARHARDPDRGHQPFGLRFVAHCLDGRRRRADEDEAGVLARFCELGILGEKAVARMHRVGARMLRRGEDRLDIQIALPGRSRSDAHRLVRRPDMQRIRIGVAEDRDGANPEIARRARDAAGDLAAVRDQDFGKRHG